MTDDIKNKHGETLEETEEYVKELEESLYSNYIFLKFVATAILLFSYAGAKGSLWWLAVFAATGSGGAAETETALGTSFLILGYNLSVLFCIVFMAGATAILLIVIWEREIVILCQKLHIAINGASKELHKESKKED